MAYFSCAFPRVWESTEADAEPQSIDPVIKALQETALFLKETPLWVTASVIVGITLLFFAPLFALPFLGVAAGVVLSRIVIKIIDINKPELLKSFKEKLHDFQRKHHYIQLLAILVSLIVTIWCPIGGAFLAVPAGLYKGLAVEIEVMRTKQKIQRADLTFCSGDSFAELGNS